MKLIYKSLAFLSLLPVCWELFASQIAMAEEPKPKEHQTTGFNPPSIPKAAGELTITTVADPTASNQIVPSDHQGWEIDSSETLPKVRDLQVLHPEAKPANSQVENFGFLNVDFKFEPSTPPIASPYTSPSRVASPKPVVAQTTPVNPNPVIENQVPTPPVETALPTLPEANNRFAELKIELNPASNPLIPADGRSLAMIEGKITKENGELLNEDVVVTLTSSAGKFVGKDFDNDMPGFQVLVKGGEFTIQLQSAIEAQKVKIRAAVQAGVINNGRNLQPAVSALHTPIPNTSEAYTQVEFIPHLRPSLVTGMVNLRIGAWGANFWGSRSNFLNPDLIGKGTQVDFSSAVFATGGIGEWLLTGAYNSQRALNQNCDGVALLLRGPQFCEQNYPVYGDSSTVDYLTPSTDSFYLRLERQSPVPGAPVDYGMWGDYNTQEFARASQFYTATTRSLHGFKGNISLGDLQVTGLYSRDIQGFQRDAIVPDGTSGYYFLSQRLVIAGSENLFVETEEINRPGTIIERKALYRGADYEIDYDRGTILFRRPMLATELNPFGTTLVRRIVATYQFQGTSSNNTSLYAGRLQYNFSQETNHQSWLGTSYLQENQGSRTFELYGSDLFLPLGEDLRLIGEFARSRNTSLFSGNVSGNAYRVELAGTIFPGLQTRSYYRSVEAGFTNNATASFTPGQTRYGGAIAATITPTTFLNLGYDYESNFGIAPAVRTDFFDLFKPASEVAPGSSVNNDLRTISAGLLQKIDTVDLSFNYVNRSRTDRAGNLFNSNSSQLVSQLNVPLTESLAFRAQNELNLSGSDPLYPNRTTTGLEWAVYPGVKVRLAHQFFDGGLFSRNSITSLDTILEQSLGENTSLTGRYSIISGLNGTGGQGALGINHRVAIAPGLRATLGYEHIFNNLYLNGAAGQTFAQPYAPGQSGSALSLASGDSYSVGVEYLENPDFKASARFEQRLSSGGNNTVISLAGAGKISPELTGLLRYQQGNSSNQLLRGLGDTATLKLGLAYRDPSNDQFNGLLRYEFRQNPSTIPETLLLGSGTGSTDHVISAEGIYAPDWQWEFYGKYAMRYSNTFLAQNFSNSSTVYLSQLRTTYRMGYDTDLAAEVRWIGQPSVNFSEIGFAIEGGYYLTPDLRAYIGYSFGGIDDRDFSGYRSAGGPYIGITLKVNELFDGFGRQTPVPAPVNSQPLLPPASVETSLGIYSPPPR